MPTISEPPTTGQTVRVRMRRWLVENVDGRRRDDDSTLVHLACLDDDAQGEQLAVLWEKEIDPEIQLEEGWRHLGEKGFDNPRLFAAFLHTMRWNCVTATDPKLFQAPFRAGIQILTYQLEPLRKALQLPRVNLFIADDVGLGKTIEAGLIARELLLRKKVDYIVVVCPPSVLLQWHDELETRFGLTFAILDRDYIARMRSERGYGTNPWTTHTRFLVSERLLIDEVYAAGLRDALGELRPGALLIFDEAHHAAPASGSKYAIDSKITRAMRDLAARFEHRLFLSATPHNGHSNSFSALLEILDPQRFCRGVPVRRQDLEDIAIRRIKEDLRVLEGGFPKRETPQIDIDGLPEDTPELQVSRLLDQYRELREQRLESATKGQQRTSGLLISGLQQRLLSSIEAFARTLRKHKKTVQRLWEEIEKGGNAPACPAAIPEPTLFNRGLDADDERATEADEVIAAEEEAEIDAASSASFGPVGDKPARSLFEQEQQLLAQMTEIAEQSRHLPDARVKKLIAWIRQHLLDGSAWKDTRLLIFTEYDDTKRYLVEQLRQGLHATDQIDDRIAVYHGPTPIPERERLKRAFNADPHQHPLRILVATDAAREGLNLQNHCFNLFHFDLPWNPSRLEQRNGRIDRKLQRAEVVFCHYFFYRQRVEDRVLRALVRKSETIRRELGSLSQVLENRIDTRMRLGIRHRDADQRVQEIEAEQLDEEQRRTVEEEFEETEDRQARLRAELERLRTQLADSRKWINFEAAAFRDALSCSLQIQNAPPLQNTDTDAWTFPELDKLPGADPTWCDTIDTLRTPQERDQKPWQWRKEATVRPVVFADRGRLDDSVVHLHLEHRVAQRLLGRFRSQGFVHHDLSRACLAQSRDAIPRVVLLGRLSLYGPGAARLHEEVVAIAARWTDPQDRARSPLKPYAEEAKQKTLGLLEEALRPSSGTPIPRPVQDKLSTSAHQDIQELRPHLEARGKELEEQARQMLADRGRREAESMGRILADQKKRILGTDKRSDKELLKLDRDLRELLPNARETLKEEIRQLESNRRHWQKRLAALDDEARNEPRRIQELYEVRAVRLEPVGLVYLYPESG